jgi:tetratricopeptide (TPR) repeat protein
VQADPRSPEHGQYGFLQDLVRHVAYETLSKRERRARHLAAAAHLHAAFGEDEDEVVEVIASHYLAALEAVPDADDATEIVSMARATLVRAGERAESLAAAAEARRYFERAVELADDPSERARLLDRAGEMAMRAADTDAARALFDESIVLYEERGDTHAAARVLAKLSRLDANTGRRDEAIARAERAFAVIAQDAPDEGLAVLAARLAILHWFSGDSERADERAEFALDIAEAHAFPEALALALRARAGIAYTRGHMQEAEGLVKQSLEIALDHGLLDEAYTDYYWLSDRCFQLDEYERALGYLDESLALARRRGNRPNEWAVLAEQTYPLFMLGRWDEALAVLPERLDGVGSVESVLQSIVEIHLRRGELAEASELLSIFSRSDESTDIQVRLCYLGSRTAVRRAEGRLRDSLADGEATILEATNATGLLFQAAKQALVEAIEAAFELADTAKAEELLAQLEAVPVGTRGPYLDAHAKRFRGRLARDPEQFEAAADLFRQTGIPFWLAVTLLEHGEMTGDTDLIEDAREIFEGLGATPWLERVDALALRSSGAAAPV